jgi:hypothetical protein
MRRFLRHIFPRRFSLRSFSSEVYNAHYDSKRQGLERVLGPMHDTVDHAIVPFAVGGPLDIYYFPSALPGTVFATMELIEPDGSGPKPSSIGTYELVAATRLPLAFDSTAFSAIEHHLCSAMTAVARYSYEAVLNPGDTCEVPGQEGEPNRSLVFDEYGHGAVPFDIGAKRHGLLLCIEIFADELELARTRGSGTLLDYLRQAGHYPYSDLDRPSMAASAT